jgi:hypothetical protein
MEPESLLPHSQVLTTCPYTGQCSYYSAGKLNCFLRVNECENIIADVLQHLKAEKSHLTFFVY